MTNVIELFPKQVTQGVCFCHGCHHSWVGQVPIGTTVLECPECHDMKGTRYGFIFPEQEKEWRWQCECTGQLFFILVDGYLCVNCGRNHPKGI